MSAFFFQIISRVLAQDDKLTEEQLRTAGNVGHYVELLYKWGIVAATSLAVLVVIYAGYLYAMSQGNPDSTKLAKDLIVGALVGLALIILAGVILKNVVGINYP